MELDCVPTATKGTKFVYFPLVGILVDVSPTILYNAKELSLFLLDFSRMFNDVATSFYQDVIVKKLKYKNNLLYNHQRLVSTNLYFI